MSIPTHVPLHHAFFPSHLFTSTAVCFTGVQRFKYFGMLKSFSLPTKQKAMSRNTINLEIMKYLFHHSGSVITSISIRRICKTVKLTVSFAMTVRLHCTTWLPMDRFQWNFVFEATSKICWENSSFSKIWQELQLLNMKAYEHFWEYLGELFL